MSFALELYADVSDWEQAERVAEATASSGRVAVVAGRHNLAATVLALSEVLDAGWAVRAYWGGDPLDGEREVTAHELADLIEQSRLDRRTLHRVR